MPDIFILNIETTTKNCSVSVSKNGQLIALKEVNEGNYAHAELLNPFIEQVLKESNLDFQSLDAVAVSKGPGSYTGLRIGVSTAKGLCFALDIPLIGIETMRILATKIVCPNGIIIPMLDARRMEVYQAIFDFQYSQIVPLEAVILNPNLYDTWLKETEVHFVGNAVEKCSALFQHPNAVFHKNTFPSAKEMVALSYQKYQEKEFEDLAYFEPYYLKEFIITKKV